MNWYGLVTIIATALMAIGESNPVHHRQNDDNLWVVMSGVMKLEKPSSMRLCGKKLDEVLTLVCHGHYNKRTVSLRTNQMPSGNQFADSYHGQVPSEEVLALTESLVTNLLNRNPDLFNRRVRTASHECCQNSCSLTTLRSYCRSSSATNMPNMTPDSASE